jgi:hypothetical protein
LKFCTITITNTIAIATRYSNWTRQRKKNQNPVR